MKYELSKEIPLLIITVFPALFLWHMWSGLPEEVPMHWNLEGEIDRYGSKMELLIIAILMPVFLYTLLTFIPMIDPKHRISEMGGKWQTLKTFIMLFISLLMIYILYSVREESLGNPNFLLIIIGAFFALLGNYFKAIKPNYFVGIRTPWTLENETVWKKTHRLAGVLWLAGGILIMLCCLFLPQKWSFITFIGITAIICILPIVHSYRVFKQLERETFN